MSAVIDRIIRDLRRAGDEREARAVELVQELYGDLDLSELIALLRSATEVDSPLARVRYMPRLMDAWDDATAFLIEPPELLGQAIRTSLEAGVTATTEMFAASQLVTDAFTVPPTLQLQWMELLDERMREFWGAETPRIRTEVQAVLRLGLERGQGIDQIAANMQDRASVSRARSVRVARQEIGNAASYAMRESQAQAGITHYIWRAAGDKRVRPLHRARNGKEFAWDNPPSDGHPGEPFLCRCVAVPVLKPRAT